MHAHAGLSVAPWDGDAVPELFRRASLSAREAVANGATDAVWHANTHTLTGDDLALLADLGMAEERGELTLVFQPQVAASTGEVVSVEALLRWKSRTRGDVSPGLFIPLAERTGLINRLTEWVLPEALERPGAVASAGTRDIDVGESLSGDHDPPGPGRVGIGRTAGSIASAILFDP